jgi:hypothetical protein
MGITAGEWFLGITGIIASVVGVAVLAMLNSAQGQRVALWEAIAEIRKDGRDTAEALARLEGQCYSLFGNRRDHQA